MKKQVQFIVTILLIFFFTVFLFRYYAHPSSPSTDPDVDSCSPNKVKEFFHCADETAMNLQDRHTFYKTIKLITQLLDQNNIKYFIMEGSLLGVMRNKGLIPYDDDFDIGVFQKDRPKVRQIMEHLQKTRNSTCRYLQYEDQHDPPKVFLNYPNCFHPKMLHKYCWPYVDLFYLTFNGTHYQNPDKPDYASSDIYPLRRAMFDSVLVWIPHNWKGVVTNWKSAMETCCTNTYNHKRESQIPKSCHVCIPCRCVVV